ncbi:MAG: FtsX-like permease family protein, partial [Solibacillus sp.]
LVIAAALFVVLFGIIQRQVQKSMRLLPLQIMTDNHDTELRFKKGKLFVIGSVAVIALLCFLTGIVGGNSGESALQILIGSILITLIILYLMPYLFSMLLKIGLQPVRMLLGKEAYLACQQLMPQVRKNMPIVLSIIGLMVILIFGTTLFKSSKENEKDYIGYLYEAPVVIKNDLSDPTFTNDIVKEIEALPSVDYAYARGSYTSLEMYLNGSWEIVHFQAIDIKQLIERGEMSEIAGPVEDGIIVTTDFAKTEGLAIGDEIRLGIYKFDLLEANEISPLKVVGIIEPKHMRSNVYFDWSSRVAQENRYTYVQDIMVETSDIEQTLSELSFLHERWPALTFSDYDTYLAENERMYYQRWSLFIGVLIVLVVATCLGVIQTLLHTIYGKRTDYAIQRLIGLTPNGLMKLILSQVLSFVLYGLAVGTLIGTAFTKLLSLVDQGAPIFFDFKILLGVSAFFLFAVILIFSVQGYWISRKTLANELVE